MNIYNLIEEAHLDRQWLTPEIRNQILNAYPFDHWLEASRLFVRSLDPQHQVPGRSVFQLMSINDDDQQHQPLTHKQKWLVVSTLIDYWDQMSITARAKLDI